MTKILWYSRHHMTPQQLYDLEDIYGEIKVLQVIGTAKSWEDVALAGKDCDILATVLPPALLADLTNPINNIKPVICAITNRIPTGDTVVNPATGELEEEFMFRFAGWEQIERVEIITRRLSKH